MRGVPAGRGESEYLHSKYSKMPAFHRKAGTPSDPAAPGFARIHRATSPINGGGKSFFDTSFCGGNIGGQLLAGGSSSLSRRMKFSREYL